MKCAYLDRPHDASVLNAWRMMGADNFAYLVKFSVRPDRTYIDEVVRESTVKSFELPALEQATIAIDGGI